MDTQSGEAEAVALPGWSAEGGFNAEVAVPHVTNSGSACGVEEGGEGEERAQGHEEGGGEEERVGEGKDEEEELEDEAAEEEYLGQSFRKHPEVQRLLEPLRHLSHRLQLSSAPFPQAREAANAHAATMRAAEDEGLQPASPLSHHEKEKLEAAWQDMVPCKLQHIADLYKNLQGQASQNPEFFGPDGEALYQGLARMLAEHGDGAYRREDVLIGEAIQDYVVKVFAEIEKDSSSHVLRMDQYRTQIERGMQDGRRCSEELGAHALVPDRLNIEKRRTSLATTLCDLFEERAKAVKQPSGVPKLLQKKIAEFQTKNESEKLLLREKLESHQKDSHATTRLIERYQEHRRRVIELCDCDIEKTNFKKRSMEVELVHIVEESCAKLTKAGDLISSIHDAEVDLLRKKLHRGITDDSISTAISALQQHAAKHGALSQRFNGGSALLAAFESWLGTSYSWMEKTLMEKRLSLEREIPAEQQQFQALLKELDADLSRRAEEQKWAIHDTQRKLSKAEKEASRLERIKGRRADAARCKQQVEEFNADLRTLDATLSELLRLMHMVKSKRSSHIQGQGGDSIEKHGWDGAGQWVKGFFYNSEPPETRYFPLSLPYGDGGTEKDSGAGAALEDAAPGQLQATGNAHRSTGVTGFMQRVVTGVVDAVTPRRRKRCKSAPTPEEAAEDRQRGSKRPRVDTAPPRAASSSQPPPSPPPRPPSSLTSRRPHSGSSVMSQGSGAPWAGHGSRRGLP